MDFILLLSRSHNICGPPNYILEKIRKKEITIIPNWKKVLLRGEKREKYGWTGYTYIYNHLYFAKFLNVSNETEGVK